MRLGKKKIIVAGLFSAKEEAPDDTLKRLAQKLEKSGAHVVGLVLQRKGVSRDPAPGGADRMNEPMSKDTIFGKGKTQEIADLCVQAEADLVVTYNDLSEWQRERLAKSVGVAVQDARSIGKKV